MAAPPAPCTRVAPTGNPRRTTGRRVTPRGSASRGGAAAAREGGSVARPSPPQLHYRLPDLTLLRSLLLLRAQAACVHTGAGEDNGIGHNQELTEISLGFHSFPGPIIFTRTFSMVGARAARRSNAGAAAAPPGLPARTHFTQLTPFTCRGTLTCRTSQAVLRPRPTPPTPPPPRSAGGADPRRS
eukprot:SAG25_NODE_562_length_6909_cov_2.841557_13_plen_185_part_00